MATTCVFNAADDLAFPFEYKDATGALVTNGTLVNVPGFSDPVCVFTRAACSLRAEPKLPDGSSFSCCEATSALGNDSQTWYYPMIAFAFAYVSVIVGQTIWVGRRKRQGMSTEEAKKGGPCAGLQALRPRGNVDFTDAPAWMRYAFGFVMIISIGAVVAEATIMPISIQQNLTPADGAARLAMAAFLTPVAEVFRFLEDAMVVKVGYALSSGRLKELNTLLHVSVIGGLLSGVLAFLFMLVLALWRTSAAALLNPSAASNQALIDAGCDLIPTTDELLSHAKVFWLLQAAAWIPKFAMSGVSGFFAGSGRIMVYMLPMVIQGTTPIALWYGLLPLAQAGTSGLATLSVLGIATSAAPWLIAIAYLVYLGCNKSLREQYKLTWLLCKRGSDLGTRFWDTVKQVAKEGAELMVVDLAVQLSLTVTVYLAANHSTETAYKVAAAQAAYWVFGPSWLVGLMLFFKVFGAQLIAKGEGKSFANGFAFIMYIVCLMSVAAIVAAFLKREQVAFNYGESACLYAAKEECAPAYAAIFQGADSLASVFEAFGPTVCLNMYFLALRSGLATCGDFKFMAKASVAALIAVYIPVVIIVAKVLPDYLATGYYVAMYAPHFAMIVIFGWRMAGHVKALKAGLPGPWTKHMRRGSVVSADYRSLPSGAGAPPTSAPAANGGSGGSRPLSVDVESA